MLNNALIADLIRETITEGEAYEVALYAVSRYGLLQSAQATISGGGVSVPNVSPEALLLTMEHDIGLTNNEFYKINWVAIRALLLVEDIEGRTKTMNLKLAAEKDDHISKLVVRDLVSPMFSVLTLIVLLSTDKETAKEFDFKLKRLCTISPEQERYFRDAGV